MIDPTILAIIALFLTLVGGAAMIEARERRREEQEDREQLSVWYRIAGKGMRARDV